MHSLLAPQLTLLVVQVSILYYGGHLVISGQMSSGNLISFIIYEFVLGDCMEVSRGGEGRVWGVLCGCDVDLFCEVLKWHPRGSAASESRLSGPSALELLGLTPEIPPVQPRGSPWVLHTPGVFLFPPQSPYDSAVRHLLMCV